MNLVARLQTNLPSRIITVFLLWTLCVFIAAGNYCLLFLSTHLPQLIFIPAIFTFPILILGLMISMIRNPLIDQLVTYGLLIEVFLLAFLGVQLMFYSLL